MMTEDFSLLENIVEKNIAENSDPTKFNFKKFVSEMEQGFNELGFRENYAQGVENVLIIRFDHVGDFIVTTPAIREIRKHFPFAYITLIVHSRVYSLAKKCPYVNKVLAIEGLRFREKDVFKCLKIITEFAKENLWSKRYRLALDFRTMPHFSNYLISYMSGARKRVCYGYYGRSSVPEYSLLTDVIKFDNNVIFDLEKNLHLLKSVGIQVHSNYEELYYDKSDLYQARYLLANFGKGKVRIGVGISANDGERCYPTDWYLTALKKIVGKGGVIVVFGGPSEIKQAKFLQDSLPNNSVLNLPELGLGWTVDFAVMSQLDMYIGNFSGICDVAQACNLPIIALSREAKNRESKFNVLSQFHRFFPWQTPAIVLQPNSPMKDCVKYLTSFRTSTCIHDGKPHCIKQIKPEEIVTAYDKMVEYIKTAKKVTVQPLMSNRHSVTNLCSMLKLKHQKSLPLLTGFDAEVSSNFNFISK